MGVLDDQPAVNARKPRPSHPKGWNPGEIEWDPNRNRGFITADPTTPGGSPQFTSLLGELCENIGEDPADYEIVGQVQVRRWKSLSPDGPVWLYYHRATIQKRAGALENDVDVDALLREVSRRKPRKLNGTLSSTGGAGLVVAMGDWQVGKSDGDGVQGTIDRLARIPDLIEQRWRQLRKIGVPLEVVYLCFGGDLKESCNGHYAQQQFRTVLNNRDQRKIIRHAADRIIDRAAGFAPKVAVKVVGGNHGEEREGGKSHTDFADNVDVAVIEDVAYAYGKSDRYGNVTFAIPNDDLTLVFDHDGLYIGLAHGHQAGFGSGDPRAKIHNWWKGQMDGQQDIGTADVLVTFHYHHPWMIRRGARTHFGSPALDGGSDWFRSATGQHAPASTLSFVVTGEGWSHMELLK
jgi:hypothetical protein